MSFQASLTTADANSTGPAVQRCSVLFKLTMGEDGVSCRGRFLDSAEHRANSAANDVEVQMGFTRA